MGGDGSKADPRPPRVIAPPPPYAERARLFRRERGRRAGLPIAVARHRGNWAFQRRPDPRRLADHKLEPDLTLERGAERVQRHGPGSISHHAVVRHPSPTLERLYGSARSGAERPIDRT